MPNARSIGFNILPKLPLIPLIRLIAILAQLVYVKSYSHRLNNYELGIYFYLMSASYFLNALIFVPLDYYQQSRIYPFRDANISLSCFLRFNRWILLLIGFITLGISVFGLFCGRVFVTDVLVCTMMSVVLYVTTAYKNLLNNLDHKLVVATLFLTEVILKVALFYAAMRYLPSSAIVLMGSNILTLLLILWLLIHVARRRGIFRDGSLHHIDYRLVAQFSYPLSIAAIANWLQSQGYRLVLVPLGYTEMVGIYATVANIGITAMNAISVIFGQLYSPRLYQTHGSYLGTYLKNALMLTLAALAVGGLLSTLVVPLLTRQSLGQYSHLMLYGIGTEAGNFLIGGLIIYMTIKNKTRIIMNGTFLGVFTVATAVALVYYSGRASVYTIGIPIVLSQAAVVAYLLFAWRKSHNA